VFQFPTGGYLETGTPGGGDDAGHCSDGLSAQHRREATEDGTSYRKWVLVVFCSTLLLISGVVATMIDWNTNLTRLSTVSVQPMAGPSRTN
jgi:hypothetical protein